MTISEIKEVLDEANCCYEIIGQDKPILSVSDAESFYPVEKSVPAFVLQTEKGLYWLYYFYAEWAPRFKAVSYQTIGS